MRVNLPASISQQRAMRIRVCRETVEACENVSSDNRSWLRGQQPSIAGKVGNGNEGFGLDTARFQRRRAPIKLWLGLGDQEQPPTHARCLAKRRCVTIQDCTTSQPPQVYEARPWPQRYGLAKRLCWPHINTQTPHAAPQKIWPPPRNWHVSPEATREVLSCPLRFPA